MNHQPRLVTLQVAAEILALSPQTVRRMIARGDLRAFRVGTSAAAPIRVDLNQIESELLRPIPTANANGAV